MFTEEELTEFEQIERQIESAQAQPEYTESEHLVGNLNILSGTDLVLGNLAVGIILESYLDKRFLEPRQNQSGSSRCAKSCS